MARLTNPPVATRPFSDSLVDLDRVLSRLRQTILQADAEREKRLRTSEYERTKAEVVRSNPPSLVSSYCLFAVLSSFQKRKGGKERHP